jgi:hypothetical protein
MILYRLTETEKPTRRFGLSPSTHLEEAGALVDELEIEAVTVIKNSLSQHLASAPHHRNSREELVLDPLPCEDERRLLISFLPILAESQLNVVQRGKELQRYKRSAEPRLDRLGDVGSRPVYSRLA